MKTKYASINQVMMISLPLLVQGCIFGENKQFFSDTNASAGTLTSSNTGLGQATVATPTPASTNTTGNTGGTTTGSTTTTGGSGTGTTGTGGTSATPSPTATPHATATPVATPTATPRPTSTPVATPTATPVATATPRPTSTPVATPTATPTPVATATPAPTVVPTATPVPTPVATPTPTATPSPTPCTAATTTENLRIMFMVDNSGSTSSTDPSHNYRVKTVRNFIASYGSHTNLSYSFGYFSGTTAKEYDGHSSSFVSTPSVPFGNSSFLTAALNLYNTYAPGGNTPYSAAFTSLKNLVTQDESAGTKEDYTVVFMSDGMPTDISGNASTGIITMVDNLRTAVQHNGSSLLTVSSVYFGPESDSASIGHLQVMANEGQGQFVDTNQLNSALQINDVITVPGSCQSH